MTAAAWSFENPNPPTASSLGAVPTTRSVATTGPLSGGGALSGDRTIALATQAKNTVLAGPATGADAAPAARALVAADLPQAIKSYTATGNNGAGHVTATGVKVGDLVILALAWNGSGAVIGLDATHFEAVVTVADQIQQNGADLSARTFLFLVQPQS